MTEWLTLNNGLKVKVKLLSRVWLCDLMDCSLPGSSVHGVFRAKSSGVVCHFLLQGIFPSQGSNPGLLHCRQTLSRLSHQGRSHNINSVELKKLSEQLIDGKMKSNYSFSWYEGCFTVWRASLVAQLVKNLLANQETRVQSLGWDDTLEKGTATHPSILAWRIPWTV